MPPAIQKGCDLAAINKGSSVNSDVVLEILCQNNLQIMQVGIFLQNRVKDDVTEQQNAFDENEADTDSESSTTGFSSVEEVMMQNARLGESPFVDAESNKAEKPDDESHQYWRRDPRVQTTTRVKSSQQKCQASSK
jgi:hypothetical protein